VLLIGLLSGTYSSIFTAVPLVVGWETGDLLGTRGARGAALPAAAR
jgi:preprotein translocase subunit SecF